MTQNANNTNFDIEAVDDVEDKVLNTLTAFTHVQTANPFVAREPCNQGMPLPYFPVLTLESQA